MRQQEITQEYIDNLTYKIIGAAIEVHKALGPGLLENIYETALLHELNLRGLSTKSQGVVQVLYKGIRLDCNLRYDVLVEDLIVVENKSVSEMKPIFTATILSYMEHLKIPKGILINFNVTNIFKEGQQTFINKYYDQLPI